MRILALTPFAPRTDATHGGGRVMAGLLARLAERHRIALAYLRGSDEGPPDDALLERLDTAVEVARPDAGASKLAHARAVLRGVPLWVRQWDVPPYREQLEQLARAWAPDVAQVHYQVMSQYADALSVPTVLVVHEPTAARAAEASRVEASLWRRYEGRALRAADATVAFTDRDRAALLAVEPGATVSVIPFGIDVPPLALNPLGDGETIVFVGNFRHAPNVDAAHMLARSVFPAVVRERPSARLRLVGAEPPDAIRALAGTSVEVGGSVPEIAPELERAAVVAIPVRKGGGLRIKTLEALAAGKAVVATPLGVEGIALDDGKQAVVATSEEAFAQAVIALLDDPDRRRRLGEAARRWALEHAGWDDPIAGHETLLSSLATARR